MVDLRYLGMTGWYLRQYITIWYTNVEIIWSWHVFP